MGLEQGSAPSVIMVGMAGQATVLEFNRISETRVEDIVSTALVHGIVGLSLATYYLPEGIRKQANVATAKDCERG
jgi:hypothetical protein